VSVIAAERVFEISPQLVIWVGLPAAIWGLVVAAGAAAGRWRTFTFVSAVLVGGLGLILRIFGLTTNIPDDVEFEDIVAILTASEGAALLSIGALIGFVARFLRQRPWGQPRSEDSVGSSGHGDQESDV